MNPSAALYLKEEIIEEGDLYICFKFLEDRFNFSTAEFSKTLKQLASAGVTRFYAYGDMNRSIDIPLDQIDFTDEKNLMGINFDPQDIGRWPNF